MRVHIVEGEPGCRLAISLSAAAVIVDALRASATAAALLSSGAEIICITREVADAVAMKNEWPDALLFGERGGLPPEGFDFGNSPRDAYHARNRRVVFTTTTGAGRMLSAWGAGAVIMGSMVNSTAVVAFLQARSFKDVVLIPAGLMDHPEFDAQEDWTASAWLAMCLEKQIPTLSRGEGWARCSEYIRLIRKQGVDLLFQRAPHADKLRRAGLQEDVAWCATPDRYDAVPLAIVPFQSGLLVGKETAYGKDVC